MAGGDTTQHPAQGPFPPLDPSPKFSLPSLTAAMPPLDRACVVFGLILLVTLMLGCARKPQTTTDDGRIIIEFWTLQLLDFKDLLEPMFAEYEAAHPNVKIRWVDIPFSEGEKRTLTAIMSPNVPDVVNLNPDFSATLANRQALVDMNEAVSAEEKAVYLPAAWEASSLGDFAFGMPWYITSKVTLYNKGLLQQAGTQKPPETFDELHAFAQTLREKTGNYAVMPNISQSGNFLKELKKSGIDPYDAESGRAVFADRGAADFLAQWVEMYRKGWIPSEALIEGPRAAVDRYQSGTLALLMTGPNFLNIVKENAPKVFEQTGVAPQFPTASPTADFSTMVLVVPRSSDHPEEAVDFALFMTNKANQLAFAQRAPVLPSVTAALQDAYFRKEQSDNLLERARSISARQLLTAKDVYQIRPRQKEINEIIDHYVQLAMLGKVDVQTAMRQAQDEANAVISGG